MEALSPALKTLRPGSGRHEKESERDEARFEAADAKESDYNLFRLQSSGKVMTLTADDETQRNTYQRLKGARTVIFLVIYIEVNE